MLKVLQILLLVFGIVALISLIGAIVLSVVATTHGSRPARVVQVHAGPYPLMVSLYDDPAHAGLTLPFAIAPKPEKNDRLTFAVTSLPDEGVPTTPVKATISPDLSTPGGVQGTAEMPVRGSWGLDIMVEGPAGQGEVVIPVRATAPPAISDWLGWGIGLLPVYGLLIFLLMQGRRKGKNRMSTLSLSGR